MFNSSQASTTASNLAAKSPEIARPQPAPVAQAPPKQKKVSEAARARADKYVESGDEAFRDQSYALALARYRRAIASAPDRAAWRFRAGQALVALGRYSDAAELFREGLEIDPAAPRGEMRLDTLYGQNKIAKVAHLESLAQEALTQPTNSDLLFLLGVELFADGQRARSRKFFERANELALGANRHLQSFLTVIPPEHEVAEKDAAAGQRDL
jgi:tetratricopeptide (TPR) repeat protein